ncbi:MAG TPA: M28 family metallopeptidase, partial [Longimicrobiales bacterium]|nr:M28 family metallopeptidase [Longimicrobiales bacterium]
MKRLLAGFGLAILLPASSLAQQPTGIAEQYAAAADRLIAAALADSAAYARLSELVDRFGHRFSGSPALERAIDWIMAEMKRDGLRNVRGEPVMVPQWVRGRESVELIAPRIDTLAMLGLGGSIGTPPEGVEGEVMVVGSFDELTRRAAEAKGKIVLFDVPFTNYGQTVQYRSNGAIAAARAGAIASLIRSVAAYSMKTPHTGGMRYDTATPRIPHAALSVEDAMMIHRMIDRGEKVRVRIRMEARTLPDAQSRNVMGEIVGRERPDEVVVLGGHIDSWDVGQGAMDDGGGVVAAWEAVRLIHKLGLKPRRTIRVVGWTNEENGLRGGNAYRDAHQNELNKHVLAIESDAGVFKPTGFGFSGSDDAFAIVQQVGRLLDRIGAGQITRGGGGADIGPIMQQGVPGMGLNVDGTRYFWYHHSEADTIDKLDPHEVALCVATMAVMA